MDIFMFTSPFVEIKFFEIKIITFLKYISKIKCPIGAQKQVCIV